MLQDGPFGAVDTILSSCFGDVPVVMCRASCSFPSPVQWDSDSQHPSPLPLQQLPSSSPSFHTRLPQYNLLTRPSNIPDARICLKSRSDRLMLAGQPRPLLAGDVRAQRTTPSASVLPTLPPKPSWNHPLGSSRISNHSFLPAKLLSSLRMQLKCHFEKQFCYNLQGKFLPSYWQLG